MRASSHITVFAAAAAALLSLAASSSYASSLTFSSARFSITTLDGSARLTDTFTPSSPISTLASPEEVPTRLESDEILRITFVVPTASEASRAAVVKRQSETTEEDSTDREETKEFDDQSSDVSSAGVPEQIVVQIVNNIDPTKIAGFRTQVNLKDGKVSWTQRVDRLPVSALASHDPTYTLRLVLGSSSSDAAPLALDLGQVQIPFLASPAAIKSAPSSARETMARDLGFYPWEEKRHTFRKEVTEGMPGKTRSLVVAAVIVLVPWLVLSGLLSTLLPSLDFTRSPSKGEGKKANKASTLVLFVSLFFLETLGYRYYRGDFVLFTMLPWFLAGAFVAAAAILAGGVKGVGLRTGA